MTKDKGGKGHIVAYDALWHPHLVVAVMHHRSMINHRSVSEEQSVSMGRALFYRKLNTYNAPNRVLRTTCARSAFPSMRTVGITPLAL